MGQHGMIFAFCCEAYISYNIILVSGLSKKECLKGYAALSKVCSRFGCIWIVFAVVNIALSIVMAKQTRI